MRHAPVGQEDSGRRPKVAAAKLPDEVAELALLPAVTKAGGRGDGIRTTAEQPFTPDRCQVRTGTVVERHRREDARVQIDHREAPGGPLEHLELEDPLPAQLAEQAADAGCETGGHPDRLRERVLACDRRPEAGDPGRRQRQQAAVGDHACAREEPRALEPLHDEGGRISAQGAQKASRVVDHGHPLLPEALARRRERSRRLDDDRVPELRPRGGGLGMVGTESARRRRQARGGRKPMEQNLVHASSHRLARGEPEPRRLLEPVPVLRDR